MSKISKKVLSLVLALVLSLSVCVIAFAAPAFDFSIKEDNTGSITGCDGDIEDGVLELIDWDDFYELKLTSVAANAFAYDESDTEKAYLADVTTVIVPAGVNEIGSYAFAYLPALTSVEIKGDVKIDENAFAGCAALKEVTFGGDAHLYKDAFAGCDALETLNVNDDASFNAESGALNDTAWYKNYTVDFVTIGSTLIAYKGQDEEEVIPENVTRIGASAFEGNTTLKKIVFSQYVTEIGDNAFADCSALEEVVFSDVGTIETVGKDAFLNTPYYDNYPGEFFIVGTILIKYKGEDVDFVQIPNTVTEIAANAFDGCYTYNERDGYTFVISSIVVPASVTKVGENALALATFEDGSTYSPRIYAYAGTDAMKALKDAGYLVTAMPMMCDLNKDGKVTTADARLALRIALRLDNADDITKAAADVDGDGSVTTADARLILRIALDLEDYSAKDLLSMPKTEVELLMAYTAAMKKAAVEKVGYTKTVTNKITGTDVNLAHKAKLVDIASKNMTNTKKTYASDTQAAADNLLVPSLLSTEAVKKATNVMKDGKYYITIQFEDVQDAYVTVDTPDYTPSNSYLGKIIPVVNGQVFYNAIAANKWFTLVPDSDTRTFNCVRKYAMNYVNPTVTLVLDAVTLRAESITISCQYHFAVDGKVNGVDISSFMFKTGDGTVDRTDTITYSDFQW